MEERTILYLRIGEGKNLPRKDLTGKIDPYCIVKVDKNIVARTATIWKDLEPFWGEEYTLFLPSSFTNFSVFVYDEEMIRADNLIGKVTMDRGILMANSKGQEKWFPLIPGYRVHNNTDIQGEIRIEIMFYDQGDVRKIKARILEVRDLPDAARNSMEPSVTLSVVGESSACQLQLTLKETVLKLPEGNKRFWTPSKQKCLEFDLKEPTFDYKMTAEVKIESDTCWCSGKVSFVFSKLQHGQIQDMWYKLQPLTETNEQKTENLGSIRMKVRLTQERILPHQCYQSLVDVLVNSICDPDSQRPTALSLIEKLTPADQVTLAHQLVRLFIGRDLVIEFLDYMTLQEIKKSTNPFTLFRSNSLAAKCMEQFMKIVGMPYLSGTLKPVLDKIFEERKYCELDPSKTAERRKSSTFRRLSNSLKPVDEQERSLSVLTAYLEAIMTSILSSVNSCPTSMRAAFKNIAHRASDHFREKPGSEDAKYTAVSGFLFLRFFAPAVLGPKLFGLQENHAEKNVSRTLTILAKTVQKIGNIEFPHRSGKEEWMESLHTWIAFYTDEVKDFLDKLTDVNDAKVPGCDDKRSVFSHAVTIKQGFIKKCSYSDTKLPSGYNFKKRYCWLNVEKFQYAKSNDSQTRQFLPTKNILAVERVDESTFQTPNVFQMVSKDDDGALQILYLATQDVNEMNQWLSAIRKTTISNSNMLNEFHPGAFHKTKWTCCKQLLRQAAGCQLTNAHVTLSDWRDPLDPDSETQMIFTQLLYSREELRQKFLQTTEFGKDSKDNNNNCQDSKSRRQRSSSHSTVDFDERTVAEKLLEVINELEKAHQIFEEAETSSNCSPRVV